MLGGLKRTIFNAPKKNDTLNDWTDWVETWYRHAPMGQDKRGDGNLDIVDQEPRYRVIHLAFH